MSRRTPIRAKRSGAAALELAILLPLLIFLFIIGIDYARVFYSTVTITNCARNGAIYGSLDPTHSVDTTGIQSAAIADAANLNPAPDVSSTVGVDSAGDTFVSVTVTGSFQTVTNFPGVPTTTTITRTVQMRVQPLLPKNS